MPGFRQPGVNGKMAIDYAAFSRHSAFTLVPAR
jgi:hypothetical protein